MVWVPLAEDDPLPGDPYGLTELAAALRRDAADVQEAIDGLNGVDAGTFWEGDAADAFAERRGRLIPDLRTLVERISNSANALAHFAHDMDDAQTRARTAVLRARAAEANLTRAQLRLHEEDAAEEAADRADADWAARNPGVPPPPRPPVWVPNWQGVIDDAQADLAAARHLFDEAVDDYVAAAHRCAEALEDVADDGLRNPRRRGGIGGFFDDVTDGLGALGSTALRGAENLGRVAAGAAAEIADQAAELAEDTADAAAAAWNEAVDVAQDAAEATLDAAGFVVEHLDVVSEGLGVAAMVTGFLPGMQGVSLAISGVKLALDVGLVLAGEGDMGAVWGDLAGFALFGAGRAFTGLARANAGRDAMRVAERSATQLRALTAEVAQGENLVRNAGRLSTLGQEFQQANQIAQRFGADAARPVWQQTVHMLRHFTREVPGSVGLNLSRTAATYAEAKAVTDAVSTSLGIYGVGETLRRRDLLPDFSQPY